MGLTLIALLAAGTTLSLALEKLVRPCAAGLKRPFPSVAIHAGLFILAAALALIIVRRPAFAALLVLAGQLAVIQISNAKYQALREPFLFSDFGIFSQMIKHPRLYLPFLGIGRASLIALVVALAVGFGWWVEKPAPDFIAWAGGTSLAGLALVALGLAVAKPPELEPEKDLADQGLFTSIAQYWLREKTTKTPRETPLPFLRCTQDELPDIIVIQSESFFDARKLCHGIKQEVLHNYDEACRSATMHGRLRVPAWGANTMRSEFAFLTGLTPASLGIHRFNPYRRVTRRPLKALPAILREAGYQTTCIHPHPARFFRRDRAFPHLGFERFVGIQEFRGAEKAGPYISDTAVTDKLLHELEVAAEPSFFFLITMENHGPLHLEGVTDGDVQELYQEPPPAGCEDLTVYLRHLRNADRQLGRLRAHLRKRTRPTILCFYGEHLPSMPRVYDALGVPDGKTNYFLELPKTRDHERRDSEIEELPMLILQGLATT
jgi:hypothetical protein